MIAVDSSALIAIVFEEPGAAGLVARLARSRVRQMSAANYGEAGAVLAGDRRTPSTVVIRELDAVLGALDTDVVPFDAAQARIALEARVRFGCGFGHPAKLNLGDCFAYAPAKTRAAPLLFVGDDFRHTDIEAAL